MNIELIKSYILAFLVCLSLLLTFFLWNYKPNYEHLFDPDYVDEINLGGQAYMEEDIVQPESIIFKRHDNYFGFSSPKDTETFYKEMHSWVLNDFWIGEATGSPPNNAYQVEVIFPDAMSLDILPTFFDMEEDEEEFPEWSFQRMYLTLDQERSTVIVHFLSVDGRYHARATVNNAAKHNLVRGYIDTLESMSEYILLTDSENPIYIKKGSTILPRHSVTINTIDQVSLVNALFKDPSAVRRNVVHDETIYTDGQRQMSVFYNRWLMEFVNPYQTYDRMSSKELITRSFRNLNESHGWTDTYQLMEVDPANNRIAYQMYYNGYPVFNPQGLATIEQEWHDQELVHYTRPLFNINDSLAENQVELSSGSNIKAYLEKNTDYEMNKIQNIKIGYRLSFQDSGFRTLILEPAWYLKYNGSWQEINLEDAMLNKEVS